MITKGYVEEVIDNNSARVRCPIFDKIDGSDLGNNNLSVAFTSSLPNSMYNLKPGDVVFVGFENDDRQKPIILGYLYLDNDYGTYSSLNLKSLEIQADSHLSSDTSIGDVSSFDISCLENLDENVQDKFNSSDTTVENNNESITVLDESILDLSNNIDSLLSDSDALLSKLDSIKKLIGDFGDTSEKTLFGRIQSYIKNLEKLNESLGDITEDQDVYSLILELESMAQQVSNNIANSHVPYSSSSSNMISRAEKMINVSWTPKRSFKKWNSSEFFEAGKTYYGMPYTLFGFGYSYDTWKENAENNETSSGNVTGYGYREGPKYGSCCADFVSEVLGLSSIIRSCAGLAGSSDLSRLTGDSAKISNLQVADVLLASNNSHVMWVGSVDNDNITLYEQTPPLAHKITLSKLSNSQNGYFYYGGTLYDSILRPSDTLLAADSNSENGLDDSGNIQGDWICKGSKTYGSYGDQALTENEYMHNALVFWSVCKSSGWTAAAAAGAFSNTYGESTGNPWSYGTGGGGLFGFTPFDSGTYYGTGIYDYASNVLGNPEYRWSGDAQVGYINWQASNIDSSGWTGVFAVRGDGYWNYSVPGVPDNLSLSGYMSLSGVSATDCAKLWLARYGVVSIGYHGSNVDGVVNAHTMKAEELYNLYSRY